MQDLLNPHILKMKSKGVDSVRARVCNLSSLEPSLSHVDLVRAITDSFYQTHASEYNISQIDSEFGELDFSQEIQDYHNLVQKELLFNKQTEGKQPHTLIMNDELDMDGVTLENSMLNIRNTHPSVFEHDLVKEVWTRMTSRDWILGETPSFSNNVEFKNQAGFFDIYFESNKGVFTSFMVFSDCLFSVLVEAIEQEFSPSNKIVCGREGVEKVRLILKEKFESDQNISPLLDPLFDDLASSFE